MDSWLGYQGDQLGNEVQWFKQDVSGPVAVRCFELVARQVGEASNDIPYNMRAKNAAWVSPLAPSLYSFNNARRLAASRFPIPLRDTNVAKCFSPSLILPLSQ